MYFPYLRGKQYELIAARELSEIVPAQFFRPIIEPVRNNLSPLFRTIKQLNEQNIEPLIVVNPLVGDFSDGYEFLLHSLIDHEELRYLPCIVIRNGKTEITQNILDQLGERSYAIQIIDGIDTESIQLSSSAEITIVEHDAPPTALARLTNVVLIGDFFKKQKRNADYSSESSFSHLHASFSLYENAVGFSDFTVIGSNYSEVGGPAYVVTIHMSYINREQFEEMFVRHYSSTDDGLPTDPAGKFAEALQQLMADVNIADSVFFPSTALNAFKELHIRGHYPGLGQVKKLSIKHHVETVCNYLEHK